MAGKWKRHKGHSSSKPGKKQIASPDQAQESALPESNGPLLTGTVSRWAGVMLVVGLTLVALLLLAGVYFVGGHFPIPVPTLSAILAALWAVGILYIPFFCHSCRFTLGVGYVEFTSGIFFQMRRRMSVGAVTAVSELRSPFSGLTGTRTLLLSAMGGGMLLPLLRERDAAAVMGYILDRMGKAAGNG